MRGEEALEDSARGRPDRAGLVLAFVLTAWAQIEVWVPAWSSGTDPGEPRWLASLLTLLITAPLVVRKRWPLQALATVAVAAVVRSLVLAPPDGVPELFAELVAIYSAAANSDRVAAMVGLAVASPLIFVESEDAADYGFAAFLVVTPWLAGRAIRSRQKLIEVLRVRTVELQHQREEKAQMAAVAERARIARELHDVLAHSLSVVVVQAEAADKHLEEGDSSRARAATGKILKTGRQALTEVRQLLGVLRKDDRDIALVPQPGLGVVPQLVQEMRIAGLDVDLDVVGAPRELPAGIDLAAYRILQEALTNALKHAGRQAKVDVTIRYSDHHLEVTIVDDGKAIAPSNSGGHGLVGMRERVELYSGTLHTGQRPEGGYEVRVALPLGEGSS